MRRPGRPCANGFDRHWPAIVLDGNELDGAETRLAVEECPAEIEQPPGQNSYKSTAKESCPCGTRCRRTLYDQSSIVKILEGQSLLGEGPGPREMGLADLHPGSHAAQPREENNESD